MHPLDAHTNDEQASRSSPARPIPALRLSRRRLVRRALTLLAAALALVWLTSLPGWLHVWSPLPGGAVFGVERGALYVYHTLEPTDVAPREAARRFAAHRAYSPVWWPARSSTGWILPLWQPPALLACLVTLLRPRRRR